MQRLRSGSAAYGSGPSVLVLTLYLVCTLLVFSFILFEVLDVDASDFPSPAKSSIKLTEAPHDLKRMSAWPIAATPVVTAPDPDPDTIPGPAALPTCSVQPDARVSRLALPRAALPDPSPCV
jgi:hypothetical protein